MSRSASRKTAAKTTKGAARTARTQAGGAKAQAVKAQTGKAATKPKSAAPPKAQYAGGKRTERIDSPATRFADLKRRIRAMADVSAPPSPEPEAAPRAAAARAVTVRTKIATEPGTKPRPKTGARPKANARAKTAARPKAARSPARSKAASTASTGARAANRRSVEAQLAELRGRLQEMHDIGAACSLLVWDQATYMPIGGAAARGRQGATLSRLLHERFTDPAIGRLLDGLDAFAARDGADSDDAAMVRQLRRRYEKATKVPAEFVARESAHGSAAYDAWTRARPANDFAAVRPFLEKTLDLSREHARYLGPYDHIADPLIDAPDPGMTVASVRALFSDLRAQLVPIVRAITAQPAADDSCLRRHFPEPEQLAFGLKVIERFGYDMDRGRLDKTLHPFVSRFSAGDVRITTRVKENDLSDALFSTLHEAGHALYEQGVDPAYEDMGLARGASAGVHESQSRLWENIVGRSRPFWEHFYPQLVDTFPEQLKRVPLETFYRAINKVERSLIRTDADEVTYNLHVMLRFDLELDMLEGRLKVADLPEAWRARCKADLGIEPPDDRDGCLQDVHWFHGRIGGSFQGYTIGNILSAQLYAAAVQAHPDIPAAMAHGELGALHGWLRERVYRHGRKYLPGELIERATGRPMTIAPYVAYLREKYGELYELPAGDA
jgi:carboxypeptidase Taq